MIILQLYRDLIMKLDPMFMFCLKTGLELQYNNTYEGLQFDNERLTRL
jgi:hypothetical protein